MNTIAFSTDIFTDSFSETFDAPHSLDFFFLKFMISFVNNMKRDNCYGRLYITMPVVKFKLSLIFFT